MRTTVVKIGQNRNKPRIYLQGKWLIENGFNPGEHCEVEFGDEKITITPTPSGRKISGKNSGDTAVIDILTTDITSAFGRKKKVEVTAQRGKITITPARIAKKVAARAMVFLAASLFSGGGLLDAAASSAGFETVAAVEHNEKYADIWEHNHPGHMFCAGVEDVSHAQMEQYEGVGLLTMGVPCEPFSKIRRVEKDGKTKRRGNGWSDHALADMFYWGLRAVDAFNPHTVVVENVPGFLDSDASLVMEHVFARLGYRSIDSRIINPVHYGALTGRKRAVMIATMFDKVHWPTPSPATRKVDNLLLPANTPGLEWFTPDNPNKKWLFEHWEKNNAKGNGFTPPIIFGGEDYLPTIKKRYWAGQGDNFVIGHPNKMDTYRWLTIEEGKRFMGLPDDYHLGHTKTHAGEVIGQGVEVGTFSQIIRSVCRVDEMRRAA